MTDDTFDHDDHAEYGEHAEYAEYAVQGVHDDLPDLGEHLEASATERDEAKGRHPSAPPRRASWERPTRIAVGSLALVAIMFLFVFPTRSYLAQQRQVGNAREAVAALKVQNAQLAQQAKRLQTPSEIERLAREQFNMVLPNEQAYTVLSSNPTTSTTAP